MDQRRGALRQDDIADGDDGAAMIKRPASTRPHVGTEAIEGQADSDARWRRFEALAASAVGLRIPSPPVSQPPAAAPAAPAAAPAAASAPAEAARPIAGEAARGARPTTAGAWRLRLEGAAAATLIALALAFFGAPDAAPPPQTTVSAPPDTASPDLAPTDLASLATPSPAPDALESDTLAQADAGALSGLSDSAVIAWVSTADPPFRVVMHLAPEANPREVARLETAVRAWGFAPPELRPAQEPLVLPEVAFHHEADRDAALLLARIADGILPIAVLTPPQASGGADAADAASPARGTLDLMVVTR